MAQTTAQQDKKRGTILIVVGVVIVALALVVATYLGSSNSLGIDGGISADKASDSKSTIGDITKLVGAVAGLLTALTGLLKVIQGFRKRS